MVSIIGGRYGTISSDGSTSISQNELKTAIDRGRQVFIFIEKAVYHEYQTWIKNKERDDIVWTQVDSPKIFKFIGYASSLPLNNPIQPFENSFDITAFLREQFAGLFQRLLRDADARATTEMVSELRSLLGIVERLVSENTPNNQPTSLETQAVLFSNNSLFQRIRKLVHIKFPITFTSLPELNALLRVFRFKPVNEESWDEPDTREWYRYKDRAADIMDLLKMPADVFDEDGTLRPEKLKEVNPSSIVIVEHRGVPEDLGDEDEVDLSDVPI